MISLLLPVVLLFLSPSLHSQENAFPPGEFPGVQTLLCPSDTVESLKIIGRSCQLDAFTVHGVDLNADGKSEWIFYGPSGECGAHGNCPFAILKKEVGSWKALETGKCTDQECLRWANPTFSQVLKSSQGGYRDLLISSDSGSFFWVKELYRWNGNQYRRDSTATSYFFYDSDKDKLVRVARVRWEKCVRDGKGCL